MKKQCFDEITALRWVYTTFFYYLPNHDGLFWPSKPVNGKAKVHLELYKPYWLGHAL